MRTNRFDTITRIGAALLLSLLCSLALAQASPHEPLPTVTSLTLAMAMGLFGAVTPALMLPLGVIFAIFTAFITVKTNWGLGYYHEAFLGGTVIFLQLVLSEFAGHAYRYVGSMSPVRVLLAGIFCGIFGFFVGLNAGTQLINELNPARWFEDEKPSWNYQKTSPAKPAPEIVDCLKLADGRTIAVDGKSCQCLDRKSGNVLQVCAPGTSNRPSIFRKMADWLRQE